MACHGKTAYTSAILSQKQSEIYAVYRSRESKPPLSLEGKRLAGTLRQKEGEQADEKSRETAAGNRAPMKYFPVFHALYNRKTSGPQGRHTARVRLFGGVTCPGRKSAGSYRGFVEIPNLPTGKIYTIMIQ
jgi:hypothetical protein